jgi:hypothetical protein
VSKRQNLEGEPSQENSQACPPFKQPDSPSEAAKQEALAAGEKAREAGYQIGNEGDRLHGKVTLQIIETAERLLLQIKENPDSEANTLVRVLLLNQIAQIEAAKIREDPKLVFSEERRRGIEYDQEAEKAKTRNIKVEADTDKVRAEIDRLQKQIQKLEQDLRQGEMKLAQAQRVVDQAQLSNQLGQPMDAQQVYRRIAEIVGLRAPSEPGAEAQA